MRIEGKLVGEGMGSQGIFGVGTIEWESASTK